MRNCLQRGSELVSCLSGQPVKGVGSARESTRNLGKHEPAGSMSASSTESATNMRGSISGESVPLEKRPLLSNADPYDIEAPPSSEPVSAPQDISPGVKRYGDSDSHLSLSGNSLCPICQDAPCNSRTACGHQFCEGCLGSWLREHLTCPLCRKVIKPLHITIYATNNADSRELIVYNDLTNTLTYGVRCRWTIQGSYCTGRLLQRFSLATEAYEPRICRDCRGAVVIPPQAVRDLASSLRRKRNPLDCMSATMLQLNKPTTDGFRASEDLPSDEQLVQEFSLASEGTRKPFTCVHWVILTLIGLVLFMIYWLAVTHL